MKSKKLFSIDHNGLYISCVYIHGTINPYRIYNHYVSAHPVYGYPVKHRKQIAAYGDMSSTMYHVYKMAYDNEYN